MTSQSAKKPSFFRRLSLSTSPSRAEVVPVADRYFVDDVRESIPSSKHASPTNGGYIMNDSNDRLPPGAAPSALRGARQEREARSTVIQSAAQHHAQSPASRTSIAAASAKHPGSSSPETAKQVTPTRTSPNKRTSRQPIYPALASPPTSPPRGISSPSRSDSSTSPTKSRVTSVEPDMWDLTHLALGATDSRYNILATRGAAAPSIANEQRPLTSKVSSSRRNLAPTRAMSQTPPSSFPKQARSPNSDHGPSTDMSEASAYARAVSTTMASQLPHREGAASAPPQVASPDRPLPRPPSTTNGSTVHVIASNDGSGRRKVTPENNVDVDSRARTRPAIVIPAETRVRSSFIAFPRSPTLPPLSDPRKESPVSQWSPGKPLLKNQLPARTSSVRLNLTTAPTPLSPSAAPAAPSRKGPPTLVMLIAQPQIQTTLLSYLSINSFLSLTGASDGVRKRITGEIVGRWIMREWGIQVDREKGRSWPNLTVWEGFLESLLHDPASYSTYPSQWHNLLRHLSLSHSLIVLHLRSLPPTAFPTIAPLPFDEEMSMPYSQSVASLSSLPRSRVGSDAGSIAPGKMPKHERLLEIVMPEPLAAKPEPDDGPMRLDAQSTERRMQRRSSISSMASARSFAFGRKRSNMTASAVVPSTTIAAPMPLSGKAALPPVSYPTAKRYGFKRHGDPPAARSRTFSETSRPGSVFSVSSSPSVALSQWMTTQRPPVPAMPANLAPHVLGGSHRASVSSAQSSQSPIQRFGSPVRRDYSTPPPKIEPAFDKPPPFVQGRAPILRVFVRLSDRVQKWPSAEGAAAAVAELDKCGATRRLRLGDLVVNTACRQPKTTEHVLVYVPYIKHLLVPLEYKHCQAGHLPAYVDGFSIPPSYYYPFLPSPQIVYLDLSPYADKALRSLRLAFDRRDVTVASGARMTAKRYLHVAGFEIVAGDPAAVEWHGMVSLEAEGTAEGKAALVSRFRGGRLWPWEIVKEKSMSGTVWLRMVKE